MASQRYVFASIDLQRGVRRCRGCCTHRRDILLEIVQQGIHATAHLSIRQAAVSNWLRRSASLQPAPCMVCSTFLEGHGGGVEGNGGLPLHRVSLPVSLMVPFKGFGHVVVNDKSFIGFVYAPVRLRLAALSSAFPSRGVLVLRRVVLSIPAWVCQCLNVIDLQHFRQFSFLP